MSVLSQRGAEFIAHFEGVRLKLYNDPVGHCTIGVGHLVHHGKCNGGEPTSFKDGLTRNEAMALLRSDAKRFAKGVDDAVRVPLNQAQLDALISFAFNVGTGAFASSTLVRKLNQGDYAAVPSELMRWTRAGGQVLPGLVRRRRAEGELFAHRDYDPGPGRRFARNGTAPKPPEDKPDRPSEDDLKALSEGERAHLVEFWALKALNGWAGRTKEMVQRLEDCEVFIEDRCKELRREIADSPPAESRARQRHKRLRLLERRASYDAPKRMYPTAGCTPTEKAHIAERDGYADLKSSNAAQRARKVANLEWLVERRKQLWRLGETKGWETHDRRQRHRQLSIVTHHGQPYEDWKAARERPAERRQNGLSPRGRTLRWLSEHRGMTEQPGGSNTDRRPDGIRTAQVACASGGSWLVGAPWCGVWCHAALTAGGVRGLSSRMAAVAYIEDDARAAVGPYRGWTRDRSRVLRGDLVVIGGRGVHVEVVREVKPDGSVLTDGGNTSPGRAGSQSNGGGAYLRTRLPSEIWGFALVDFPDE